MFWSSKHHQIVFLSHTQIHGIFQTWTSKFFVVLLLSIIWIQTEANLILILISVFFSGIQLHKRVIGVIHQKKRKYFVSRDVTFFENQLFFTKNYLQGENIHAADNFLGFFEFVF